MVLQEICQNRKEFLIGELCGGEKFLFLSSFQWRMSVDRCNISGDMGLGHSIPGHLHCYIHALRGSISPERARLQWQVLWLLRLRPNRHHRSDRWSSSDSNSDRIEHRLWKNIWKVFKSSKFVWNYNWFSEKHKADHKKFKW